MTNRRITVITLLCGALALAGCSGAMAPPTGSSEPAGSSEPTGSSEPAGSSEPSALPEPHITVSFTHRGTQYTLRGVPAQAQCLKGSNGKIEWSVSNDRTKLAGANVMWREGDKPLSTGWIRSDDFIAKINAKAPVVLNEGPDLTTVYADDIAATVDLGAAQPGATGPVEDITEHLGRVDATLSFSTTCPTVPKR